MSSAQAPSVAHASGASPNPGLIAGRFRVLSRLGRGGAAAVWAAEELSSGRVLALKRLTSGSSRQLVALFEREYHTLCTLRHKNVVEVYDYGCDQQGPFYTMELLRGADLSESAPLPWPEVCRIVIEGALGLSLLHARRLIHRDIGPRNLWRTEDGKIKLIDFGAVTAFGSSKDVVGTPPFVAPEALHANQLDQRTDLYALGALAYYLLTGAHAYPARSLRDLHSAWLQPFAPASRRVAALGQDHLPPVPEELDALIEALLNADPKARPSTTGDLIDRLSSIAGLDHSTRHSADDFAIQQPALVGRARELRHLSRRLANAREGSGSCSVIEGRAGEGKSRLLQEFALQARLSGMAVLQLDAASTPGLHGLAEALAFRLLDTLPDQAAAAAAPYAADLSHLSAELGQRLSASAASVLPNVAGEARTRIHEALSDWFAQVAKRKPMVVLVDRLEAGDEASVAALLSLAHKLERVPLLLVLACSAEEKVQDKLSHRGLLAHGSRVLLRPLDAAGTRELLGSLFGEVPHLARLSDQLHRSAHGNPAHLLALAQHLVQQDVITNVEGTWLLPQDVPQNLLAFSRRDALAQRLSRLPAEARQVGRALSVRRGDLSLAMCGSLTGLTGAELYPALAALVQESFLVGADEGYRFADEEGRLSLLSELEPQALASVRRRLGRLLLANEKLTPIEELEAHLLLLDDDSDGQTAARITTLARRFMTEQPDYLAEAVPLLERALTAFQRAGRGKHEQVSLLAPLAAAGYYSDRALFSRYSEPAIETLGWVLGVPLMKRLQPFLGMRLSFYVGLFVAGVRFRRHKHNPCVPSLREIILLFFSVLSAFAGVSTIAVDPRSARRAASMIEPFVTLGNKTPAPVMHQFMLNLAATVEDRLGAAHAAWQSMIARMRDPASTAQLSETLRLRFLGGALYACGVLEVFRESSLALQYADELERFPIKFYQMSGDQLRTLYYAHQGNSELHEQYRRRAEMHAIQRGSAWQVELWAPAANITLCQRTNDALGTKHSVEQLQRVVKTVPSLALLLERARASYLLLRRRYQEALPELARCLAEEPLAVTGWARAQGAYARALNALGRHQEAREVCERALAKLTPRDLTFRVMNLGVQIEHAVALQGLAEPRAAAMLDQLIEQHGKDAGPLTMGALHEARARVALMAGDEAGRREHQLLMEQCYRRTGIPSLVARCEAFARELTRNRPVDADSHVDASAAGTLHSVSGSTGVTSFDRALGEVESLHELGRRALALLTEGAQEGCGALWTCVEGEFKLSAETGMESLPEPVQLWLQERHATALADDVTQTATADAAQLMGVSDTFQWDGRTYHFALLRRSWLHNDVAGAVLLGCRGDKPPALTPIVLDAIGRKLQGPLTSSRTSAPYAS